MNEKRSFIEDLVFLLEKVNGRINRLVRIIIGLGMLTMMSAIVFHVGGRYFFSKTYMGTMELIRYTMVWVSMLGAACAFISLDHVSVNLLGGYLSRRMWAKVRILGNFLLGFFMLAMFLGGIEIGLRNWHQTSMGLRIPMFFPYLAIPVGSLLTFPHIILNILKAAVETRH